jgi:hypothetical protein
MAFDWTNIGTETVYSNPPADVTRNYRGYNVGSIGLLLNIRLRIPVPGAYQATTQGELENEIYLPGDRVGTFWSPTWVQLKDEDLGNNVHRFTHATQTPGGNVIVRMLTRADMKVDRQTQRFYVREAYEVIENASLSGTDIISNSGRTGSISMTGAASYAGATSPVWQDLKVAPAGATLQLTVNAESGDDIEVNFVFSAYNSINGGFPMHTRVILDSTEVCWNAHRFDATTGGDANLCMGGRLSGLASGSYTLKAQVYISGDFNTVTQHYGTARGKLEYRLVRG